MNYFAPRWLPGGHLQSIWPALYARPLEGAPVHFRRERWNTPDQDFIDVDWLDHAGAAAPLLVMFHGLEGSSASHYAQAFADFCRARQIAFAVAHFRGCSGELNLAPRTYHSGDFEEVDWILKRFRQQHAGPIAVVGISLGGNALLRWAGEMGVAASRVVDAVASVCAPLDLESSARALGRGFNRQVYTRMFLHSMKPKALRKLAQHPGLFDAKRMAAAPDLYTFDNIVTAPLHGFSSTEDYWSKASSKPHLARIAVPALVLNTRNDPFVPGSSLPLQDQVGRFVELWQPESGGHVGFAQGALPGHLRAMPEAVGDWLLDRLGLAAGLAARG